jgi:putative glutamine amidotransferase
VRVNALHRQAIHRLGHGLRPAARDRNGILQAVEHETLPFVVGVQWHPEYLPQVRGQRRLFQALVREAKRARERLAQQEAETGMVLGQAAGAAERGTSGAEPRTSGALGA